MIGTELKEKRTLNRLSQSKLSEITGIPQVLLSAFELGKQNLPDEYKKTIQDTFSSIDNKKILISNKKRYRSHAKDNLLIPSRPRRSYQRTQRNHDYLQLLTEIEQKFKEESSTLKAMSFFAGCGGLCYGVKAAGFEIVGTNELVQAYRNIYLKNFPKANFLPNDITKITKDDIFKITKEHINIDLLIGGPPCQGFSLAGKRDVNDERNTLFQYYLEIAQVVKPKVILMENVRLLTSMKDPDGELVSERIINTFKENGYICNYFYVNAQDYGVPQNRGRVIFVAIRDDIHIPPSVPKPIYGNKIPYFSFGDAVSDLEFIESGEDSKKDIYHKAVKHPDHVIKWLIDVPQGKSAHDNQCETLRPPSGYNTTYKRQLWNEPGKTVGTTYAMISGSNNVHPIATRSLTTREALRLQSFPDGFKLTGKMGDIRTTIGNAVPPLLAYALAKHIKETYF